MRVAAILTTSRTSAAIALLAGPFTAAAVAAQAADKGEGVEFDVKTVMSASGVMSSMLGSMVPGYSGHGFAIGRRVRIDIVEGAMPPLAEKGDYMLFDSTGITIVRPSKKEFVVMPLDVGNKAMEQVQAMGMSIALGDISVKFNSLPGTDTIAGYATHHYKQTINYTLAIEAMGTAQQMKTQAATEYWVATVPGLVTSPLQQTSQMSGGSQAVSTSAASGPFKDLAAKVDSVSHLLHGSALRVQMTTTSEGAGADVGLNMTSEMSNLKRVSVAANLFVIPADYTRGASPFPGGHH